MAALPDMPPSGHAACRSGLLLGAILLTLANCADQRDWPEVAAVEASVRCGATTGELRRICQNNGAEQVGVPTEQRGTPQFYCYSGDTGISFWLGKSGLERYQVWDSIEQPDGSSGRTDPQVNVCSARAEKDPGAFQPRVSSSSFEDEPMTVGGEVIAPVVMTRVEPKWPEQITRQRTWLYALTVTRVGHVKDLQLVQGEPGIHSRLAEDAIQQWKFKPGTYRGKPVDVRYNLSVTIHVR